MNQHQPQYLRAHGKLLLTGEYFVLDGALALAVPTRFGQSLQITPLPAGRKGQLHWQSFDEQGRLWFDGRFQLPEARLEADSDAATGERLEQILQAIQKQRPDFFNGQSTEVAARLEFPRDWGLGSSSTLIACLARWADVDPYLLLADTFGGSGYDIACAFAEGPVLYERVREGERESPPSPAPSAIGDLVVRRQEASADERVGWGERLSLIQPDHGRWFYGFMVGRSL